MVVAMLLIASYIMTFSKLSKLNINLNFIPSGTSRLGRLDAGSVAKSKKNWQ
jgi:hypothetical protein